MKQKEVIFFLLVITSSVKESTAQTNVYHPFPNSNAVWKEKCGGLSSNCCCYCSGVCIFDQYAQDSLGGDTIIGAYVYKKIFYAYTQVDHYTGQVTCGPGGYMSNVYTASNYFYRGAIREDINTRKVYVNLKTPAKDTLLYDFNLNFGDTLPVSYINQKGLRNYVSSIDSILIGATYRKQYHISIKGVTNYVQLIEGIGSTFGLFNPLIPPFETACGLNCVKINSSTVYPNTTASCSSIILNINEKQPNTNPSLLISPNPTNGVFTITTEKEKISAIEIYNLLGDKIYSTSNPQIDLSSQPNGIYFLQIKTKEGNISKKIIINK